MEAIVLDDGKISIPKELRDALGIKPGTVMEMHNQAGTLVTRKKVGPDVFEKWRGRGQLPGGANANEYLGLIRDGGSR